jgi:hypothetical protein
MTTLCPNLALSSSKFNVVSLSTFQSAALIAADLAGSIPDSALSTISTANKVSSSANPDLADATSSSVASTLVKRDSSGKASLSQLVIKPSGSSYTATFVGTPTALRNIQFFTTTDTMALLSDIGGGGGGGGLSAAAPVSAPSGRELKGATVTSSQLSMHLASATATGIIASSGTMTVAGDKRFSGGALAVNQANYQSNLKCGLSLPSGTAQRKLVLGTDGTGTQFGFYGFGSGDSGSNNCIQTTVPNGKRITISGTSGEYMRFVPTGTHGYAWGGIELVLGTAASTCVPIGHGYEAAITGTRWRTGTGGSGTTPTVSITLRRVGMMVSLCIQSDIAMTSGTAGLTFIEMVSSSSVAGAVTIPSNLLLAADADIGRVLVTEGATRIDAQAILRTDGTLRIYKMPTRAAFTASASITIIGNTTLTWFVGTPLVTQ